VLAGVLGLAIVFAVVNATVRSPRDAGLPPIGEQSLADDCYARLIDGEVSRIDRSRCVDADGAVPIAGFTKKWVADDWIRERPDGTIGVEPTATFVLWQSLSAVDECDQVLQLPHIRDMESVAVRELEISSSVGFNTGETTSQCLLHSTNNQSVLSRFEQVAEN